MIVDIVANVMRYEFITSSSQSWGYSSRILLTKVFPSSSQRLKYRPASSVSSLAGASRSATMFS
jgi:hypothetical protein